MTHHCSVDDVESGALARLQHLSDRRMLMIQFAFGDSIQERIRAMLEIEQRAERADVVTDELIRQVQLEYIVYQTEYRGWMYGYDGPAPLEWPTDKDKRRWESQRRQEDREWRRHDGEDC